MGNRRPLIFGGEACRGARDQVLALSQKLNAPIGFSYHGKDVLEADNPNAVGMTGLLGWGGLQKGLDRFDALIMLGTDFPYIDFMPKQPKIVQIDSDPTHLRRRVPLELGLCGHVADTLKALLPRIKSRSEGRSFLDEVLASHATAIEHMKAYVEHGGSDGKIRPEQLGDRQSSLFARFDHHRGYGHVRGVGGAIPAAASGAKSNDFVQSRDYGQRYARRYWRANGISEPTGHRLLRRRRSLHAHGDLITIVSQKLPIKIFLFNNSTLGMVRLEMMVGGYPSGDENHNPDFSAVAKAVGFHAERVERKTDVASAIERAFAHPGPARLDITTDPNALSAPPKATYEEARGFALAMTRMVMDNRSDQVFDLVKDSIRGMV